ncbi:MAG: aspartate/glutamate racemase family protein [Casimicrobiaceae bacterium]
MRIWHQSLTVLDDVPSYAALMQQHIRRIVRPDTEVVLHGMLPGTYFADYPGDDIGYSFFFAMHATQWLRHALAAERAGFDAFAMCTLPDPMLREVRTVVEIPVVAAGEACFHLACTLGQRFGMLLFIDAMAARYQEQIKSYGLWERCVGVQPVGFGFRDVLNSFDNPASIIERFHVAARQLIADGADVIICGEIPLSVLLASARVNRIDDVPVMDCLAVTLKMAETMVDLRSSTGLAPCRRGWRHAKPRRERVEQVLQFYGLGRAHD